MNEVQEGYEGHEVKEAKEQPCPCGRMTINDCAGECGEPEREESQARETSQERIRMHELFGEPIHTYSRADALRDGVLVDVSETADEAGFVFPVAVTASVWVDIQDIPEKVQGLQDPQGRLWDLLTVLKYKIKAGANGSEGPELRFRFNMPTSDEPRLAHYQAKSVIGPGDDGHPVLTVMAPNED